MDSDLWGQRADADPGVGGGAEAPAHLHTAHRLGPPLRPPGWLTGISPASRLTSPGASRWRCSTEGQDNTKQVSPRPQGDTVCPTPVAGRGHLDWTQGESTDPRTVPTALETAHPVGPEPCHAPWACHLYPHLSPESPPHLHPHALTPQPHLPRKLSPHPNPILCFQLKPSGARRGTKLRAQPTRLPGSGPSSPPTQSPSTPFSTRLCPQPDT